MSDDSRGSYDISTMPVGVDRELERLRSQALITWPKEARNLAWMGLKPAIALPGENGKRSRNARGGWTSNLPKSQSGRAQAASGTTPEKGTRTSAPW
jgi:hypothetical protein